QGRDKLRKGRPRIVQHAHQMAGVAQRLNSRWSDDPHQKSGGYAPNESGAGTGCSPGKEETERNSEKRAVCGATQQRPVQDDALKHTARKANGQTEKGLQPEGGGTG